jgi:serine/threonine protein kinase
MQEPPKEIASGAYGCVYLPPLMCSRQKKARYNSTYLTKAQLEKYAQEELDITKKIRDIPTWRYYFIIPENNICHPTTKNMEMLHQCQPLEDANRTNIGLYHMKYGGTPLGSSKIEINKFNLRFFLRHLLEGLNLLQEKRLVHADLHEYNLLLDDKYIPRIIDFGKMLSMSEKDEDKIKNTFYIFKEGYEQMPVECLIVSGLLEYPGLEPAFILKHTIRMRKCFKTMQTFLGYSIDKQVTDLHSWTKDWVATPNADIVTFWNKYADKYDVWSAGILCLFILSKFSLWSQYKPDPVTIAVLRKICHLDPRKRWSPKQAIDFLNNS